MTWNVPPRGVDGRRNGREYAEGKPEGGKVPVAKAVFGEQAAFVVNDVIAMRTASYTANTVNQYTSRQVSTSIDVMGNANKAATVGVTINGGAQTVYRKNEYFQAVGTAGNSSASVWTPVLVTATKGGRTVQQPTSAPGHVLVPAATQTFTPDSDGNMINDMVWSYTWDAENRLIGMDCLVAGPDAQHLVFEYDWRGRRIRKTVKKSDNSIITDTKYLYDGWNLVAEFNSANQLVRSYLWGLDLSGTAQGAGGVGGLLAVTYYGTATTNCFATYDGNGNLTALVNAADGLVCARYEYGPFGELLRSTGPMAKLNPFRFSTKYQDDETDLVYYGYRYYNASTGRWLSRDPIAEKGGLNLYGFVWNRSVDRFDSLGLTTCRCGPDVTTAVQSTLNEIEATFKSWDVGKAANACRSLYMPLSTASGSWMMMQLANLGYGGWSFPAAAIRGDAPKCDRTVKYGGRCFFAGDVHYLMWGKVNNLCHQRFQGVLDAVGNSMSPTWGQAVTGQIWSEQMAIAAVDYWKTSHGDPEQYNQGAKLFTTVGFGGSYGSMSAVGPPVEQTQCDSNRSSPCGLKTFVWRWYPNKKLPFE